MAKSVLEQKQAQIKILDETTRELLMSMEKNDRRRRFWATLAFSLLLLVGVVGIYVQNSIADNNRQHIDCIVKLFTTPTPPNTLHKVITDPNGECNIKGEN